MTQIPLQVSGHSRHVSQYVDRRLQQLGAQSRSQRIDCHTARAVSAETAAELTHPAKPVDITGRTSSRTTAVALTPGNTDLIDLNADSVSAPSGGKRLTLADLLRDDGAPPRFVSPYVPGRAVTTQAADLPIMLYLPGIDGTGLAASRQFPTLVEAFDLTALSIPGTDRTPFPALVKLVVQYLEAEVKDLPPTRPVYLLGESFGGLLATAVAAERPDLVDRLILVNPATSFPRSMWPTLGPLLPSVPTVPSDLLLCCVLHINQQELYRAVPVLLSPVLGNPIALASFGVDPNVSFPDKVQGFLSGLRRLLPQLQALADILPAPTLDWKLDLLLEGCKYGPMRCLKPRISSGIVPDAWSYVEPKLNSIQQRTLLLCSDLDLLLPSREEGPRLKRKLKRCNLRTFEGRTHALLQEAGIDLVDICKEEGFYITKRELSAPLKKRSRATFGDAAAPIDLPTPIELGQATEQTTATLRRLVSPVHFTTDPSGQVHQGLEHLPIGDGSRPVLFVANHQTLALDIGFIIEDVLRAKGRLLRGLAHPAVFAGQLNGEQEGNQQFENFMSTYGAVKVGGRTFFKLMQNGEHVLLFPGGAREAYKNQGEQYELFWPEREEFVRMAARFNALIVPFGAVGCEDSFTFLADAQQQASWPLVGPYLKRRAAKNIPQARRGVAKAEEEETFMPPLVAPTLPARFYFKYGQAIETNRIDSREHLDGVYRQCKQEVEEHIRWLLHKREYDPYADFLPRVAYEASWGGKQAPTFKLDR